MVSGARERRLDGPRFRGQSRASSRSAFERLGTDAAEMAVAAGSVVERLDIVEDIGARQAARAMQRTWLPHIRVGGKVTWLNSQWKLCA